MTLIGDYTVFSLKEKKRLYRDSKSDDFYAHATGFSQQFSIENNLSFPIYVMDLDGNELAEIFPRRSDENAMSGFRAQTVHISFQNGNPVLYQNKTKMFTNYSGGGFEIPYGEFRARPVYIPEMRICLATSNTRCMVKSMESLVTNVIEKAVRIENGNNFGLAPCVLYANIDEAKYKNFFLATDESIIQIPVVSTELLDPGVGYCYINHMVDEEQTMRIIFKVDLESLLNDDDGVIQNSGVYGSAGKGSTKYKLAANYSLLKTFVDKERSGALKDRPEYQQDPDDTFTRRECEQLVNARTEELMSGLMRAEGMLTERDEELVALKKEKTELLKLKKQMTDKIDELADPETLDMRIEEKQAETKEKRDRHKMEKVKTGVGIASAVVGLVALFKSPIVAAAKWLGGLFGMVGTVAA